MEKAAQDFMALVRPQIERMHRVARHYSSSDADVREIVQEALLRAWRSFSPNPGRDYSPAWLFVILRRLVWEWRRAADRRVKTTLIPDIELTEIASSDTGDPFPALPVMSEEHFREFLDDRLAAALDSLELPFKEVIVLSVAANLTYREIAEVLDCPLGTVMSRVARARRMLRERLTDYATASELLKERRQ